MSYWSNNGYLQEVYDELQPKLYEVIGPIDSKEGLLLERISGLYKDYDSFYRAYTLYNTNDNEYLLEVIKEYIEKLSEIKLFLIETILNEEEKNRILYILNKIKETLEKQNTICKKLNELSDDNEKKELIIKCKNNDEIIKLDSETLVSLTTLFLSNYILEDKEIKDYIS